MLNNNLYNLMEQLTIESKSLWRIKDAYLKDSENPGDEECMKFWQDLVVDKEKHIADLTDLIKKELH